MTEILFWLAVFGIIYTYFGYPALLTMLARIRPQPGHYPRIRPLLTLLIPAYNEAAVIARKLENSLSLDYPREKLQILVVNDGSEDRTAEIVRGFAGQGAEICHNEVRQGKMAAISSAMPLVRGEIIVISDAANFFDPDALQELAAPFSDPSVGVVTGAKSILRGDGALGNSEGFYWKYESFILRQETRLGCCAAASGDSMALRRELFDPAVIGAFTEDFHMAMGIIRRGYRVVYASNVPSYERVSVSAEHEKERRARIIAGRYQAIFMARKLLPLNRPLLLWQIVSHKFTRPLVPLFMITALVTNLVLAAQTDVAPYRMLLCFQGIFYATALIGNHMERGNTFGKILYLPTFLLNSNMAALSGLYRFLTKGQTVLWKRVPRREEEELRHDKN